MEPDVGEWQLQQFPLQIDNQTNMSGIMLDLPTLHRLSGDSETDNEAPYVFRAFKNKEIKDSVTSTAGTGGRFDPLCCQPSDKSITQTSGCSIQSFQYSSDSSNSDNKASVARDDQKPAACCALDSPDYPAEASIQSSGKVGERGNDGGGDGGHPPVRSSRYANKEQ
jgi:hypothetical protein